MQGYSTAGQTADAEAAIRWATDYLLECNVADGTFVGQVGTYASDAAYWGRPEVMTENRWVLRWHENLVTPIRKMSQSEAPVCLRCALLYCAAFCNILPNVSAGQPL